MKNDPLLFGLFMRENMETIEKLVTFQEALENLINRYSIENQSNTPDFILAQYLLSCLTAFAVAVQHREMWYGRDKEPKPETGQEK